MSNHHEDLGVAREIGGQWEREFCRLAGQLGRGWMTPHQIGRNESAAAHKFDNGWKRLVLPDVTLWETAGEHHEVKHKNPTAHGSYGLEEYRFRHLLDFAKRIDGLVMYTIHDWARAGAASSLEDVPNRIEDWVTADVRRLETAPHRSFNGKTRYNGGWAHVPILYWSTAEFGPLADWWAA